jgi:hypothetical protein
MRQHSNVKSGQLSALAALGCFALGLACMLLLLAQLALAPEGLERWTSPSAAHPVLILAFPGVIASCLFGSLYGAAATLSGAPLWSPRAALVHLGLHFAGLFWVLTSAASAAEGVLLLSLGGAMIGIGVVVAVINIVVTASRLNRWEPAQLLVLSSLLWLMIGSLTIASPALLPQANLPGDPALLIEVGTLLVMVGCLWTALLGINLKSLQMFTAGAVSPGFLSWLGLVILNLTLLNVLPLMLLRIPFATELIGRAILLASFLVIADKVRLITSAKRSTHPAQVTSLIAILSTALLLAYLLLSANPANRETLAHSSAVAEAGIPAIIFATAVIAFVCMAGHLIPMLVWRIRCLPEAVTHHLVPLSSLSDTRSQFAMTISLLAGLAFVMTGTLMGDPDKQQLGLLALLTGLAWQFHAVAPAIRMFMLGSSPATTTSKPI